MRTYFYHHSISDISMFVILPISTYLCISGFYLSICKCIPVTFLPIIGTCNDAFISIFNTDAFLLYINMWIVELVLIIRRFFL